MKSTMPILFFAKALVGTVLPAFAQSPGNSSADDEKSNLPVTVTIARWQPALEEVTGNENFSEQPGLDDLAPAESTDQSVPVISLKGLPQNKMCKKKNNVQIRNVKPGL